MQRLCKAQKKKYIVSALFFNWCKKKSWISDKIFCIWLRGLVIVTCIKKGINVQKISEITKRLSWLKCSLGQLVAEEIRRLVVSHDSV